MTIILLYILYYFVYTFSALLLCFRNFCCPFLIPIVSQRTLFYVALIFAATEKRPNSAQLHRKHFKLFEDRNVLIFMTSTIYPSMKRTSVIYLIAQLNIIFLFFHLPCFTYPPVLVVFAVACACLSVCASVQSLLL